MITIEHLARTALRRESLLLRSLTHGFLRTTTDLTTVARPQTADPLVLGTAAALFAQPAPAWAATIGAVPEPTHLLQAALTMRRLRYLCETEAPEPLRRRQLYAPPDFLSFA